MLALVDGATFPQSALQIEPGGPFDNRETVSSRTTLRLHATMLEGVVGAAHDLCRY
jgi:hypothetical protein